MDVGSQLLFAMVREQKAQEFVQYQLYEGMFFGGEVALFKFVAAHLAQHAQLPHPDTVVAAFPDLGSAPEPSAYYLDLVEQRYAHKRLNATLLEANDLMKNQDSWTALNQIEETVAHLRHRGLLRQTIDFGHSTLVQEELAKVKLDKNPGVTLGWPTFDSLVGGVRGGDIVSFVGRPAMGKTWFLLHIAHHLWLRQMDAMFVSMEMDLLSIAQRLMGIAAKVNSKHIRVAELSSVELTRIAVATKKGKKNPGHLWVLDGNLSAEVDQVFVAARQMRPKLLVIDGAYLLGHPDKRMNKFQRVDANVELIKRRASEAALPVVLSYQFNREFAKKMLKAKTGSGGTLEDIAYSDSIGQVSTVVAGLMQEDTVETANRRQINIIKCRNEKVGHFDVHWDFNTMNFGEVAPEKVSDMKFV